MQKALFLALGIAVLAPAAVHSQTNAPKPVAVRWIVGETGGDDVDRPRVVGTNASAVKTAATDKIRGVEKLAFDMVNQRRVDAGLQPLSWSDQLEPIARGHSENMAEFDFFSHRSLDGKVVSDRADDAHLGKWRAIGENIAYNRGYTDPIAKAVDLWLNSPSHKNNMMSATWRESAIGVAIAADGSYYFTQVFLTRK